MEDVAHDDDVRLGEGIGEEVTASEGEAVREAVTRNEGIEVRLYCRELEPDALQVRMGGGDCDGDAAFGAADIDEGLVVRPGEFLRRWPGRRRGSDPVIAARKRWSSTGSW